jgi:hypothetical protein
MGFNVDEKLYIVYSWYDVDCCHFIGVANNKKDLRKLKWNYIRHFYDLRKEYHLKNGSWDNLQEIKNLVNMLNDFQIIIIEKDKINKNLYNENGYNITL